MSIMETLLLFVFMIYTPVPLAPPPKVSCQLIVFYNRIGAGVDNGYRVSRKIDNVDARTTRGDRIRRIANDTVL